MIKRIEDWFLYHLQRRCDHPSNMVAVDVLEGHADGIAVKYCRRCGAIKTDWEPNSKNHRYITLPHWWRLPDPFLWSGILLLICGLSALGQPLTGNTVSTIMVRKTTALAAGAEVITVQQPGTTPTIGAKAVRFISAYFDCTVACTFTLERNGTAATSTTLAPVNLNPQEVPPTTVAFSASNVGVGTIIGAYTCSSACQVPIDLTGVWFTASPSGTQNITLRSNSITGTVDILFKYQENANQ